MSASDHLNADQFEGSGNFIIYGHSKDGSRLNLHGDLERSGVFQTNDPKKVMDLTKTVDPMAYLEDTDRGELTPTPVHHWEILQRNRTGFGQAETYPAKRSKKPRA